jgi:cytochrome b561
MPAEQAGWSRTRRRLHWITAALVAAGFVLGLVMKQAAPDDLLTLFLMFQLHKSIGIAVIALTVWRLMVRALRGRPPWEADLPEWQRRAAALVHTALYALLVLVPVLGYLSAASAPTRVPTLFLLVIPIPHIVGADPGLFAVVSRLHLALAILLALLACGHAAAAVHNHRLGRPTLLAMWRGENGVRKGAQTAPAHMPSAWR